MTTSQGPFTSARTAEGFIKVDRHLSVFGRENVFALGDVSNADAKNGRVRRYAGRGHGLERDGNDLGIGEFQTYDSPRDRQPKGLTMMADRYFGDPRCHPFLTTTGPIISDRVDA